MHADSGTLLQIDSETGTRPGDKHPVALERRRSLPSLAVLNTTALWGLTIPGSFGGREANAATILNTIRELSRCDLAAPAILSSHLRGASYLTRLGTELQQRRLLPPLARGELIAAHACSEKISSLGSRMTTAISKDERGYVLHGQKHWVTNAAGCDLLIVIAGHPSGCGLSAVLVPQKRFGELAMVELERPGLSGVSLCEVTFTDYRLDPEEDLVGGLDEDVTPLLRGANPMKLLNFAARAVGCAEGIERETLRLLRERQAPPHPVTLHRLGEMRANLFAAQAALERVIPPSVEAARAGVAMAARLFCTRALIRIIDESNNLLGGTGYAAPQNPLATLCRDATSLLTAGTPLDRVSSELATLILEAEYD